jgi:hypothetical protein
MHIKQAKMRYGLTHQGPCLLPNRIHFHLEADRTSKGPLLTVALAKRFHTLKNGCLCDASGDAQDNHMEVVEI